MIRLLKPAFPFSGTSFRTMGRRGCFSGTAHWWISFGWRGMQQSSITDQIIIKLSRIKKIAKNNGTLLVSENIDAQLFDIINYAVFGLIRLSE